MKITFLLMVCLACTGFYQDNPYKEERMKMVDTQIIARGISDKATLNAMRKVPRHKFVPPALVKRAYDDGPLAIGYGQTISQPYIVAYMTENLKLKSTDKVLEIGTGSGYQAAVLSEIVDQVYSIEIIEELGEEAKTRLHDLGYENVHVIIGDGYHGLKSQAPFDAIIVTAAAEDVPPPLFEQLKEGGKIIIPVGSQFSTQYLILIEKKNGKASSKELLPVRFVPFTGN
jgi:protein-L-isoaspartate(D-aspartate) O-methyltransferase